MVQLRLAFICFLLCCLHLNIQIHAIKITKDWEGQHHYETRYKILNVKDRLYSISVVENVFNITSIDDINEFHTCSILPENVSEDIHLIETASLGNGKIVAIAHMHSIEAPRNSKHLIIIDLSHPCNVTITKLCDDCRDQFFVVPYHDSFDIFSAFIRTRSAHKTQVYPWRYNDQGHLIKLNHSLTSIQNAVFVQSIKPYDSSEGYFYVSVDIPPTDWIHRMIKLKHLDSQFVTLKNKIVKNNLIGVSISHGNVSYCYSQNKSNEEAKETENKIDVTCELLNKDLEPQVVTHCQISKYGDLTQGIPSIVHLPGGVFVISQIFSNVSTINSNLVVINTDGSVQEFTKTIRNVNVDSPYERNLLTLNNGEFCLILVFSSGDDQLRNTFCIGT